MVECRACHEPIHKSHMVVHGCLMGPGYTETFYCCPACGQYTLAIYLDASTGTTAVSIHGPLPAAQTEAKLANLARCPNPNNPHCRCEAHREYFGVWLDEVLRSAG